MRKQIRPTAENALFGCAGYTLMLLLVCGFLFLGLKCASSGVQAWERSRMTPLQIAAVDGNVSECTRLIKSGVSVDSTDSEGDTALDWAVFYCKIDVVRKLVELGADVSHVDQRGGFTPLMYTATTLRGRFMQGTQEQRNEIARLLIQHGADVNHAIGDGHERGDGQTALHFAAYDKNAGLVRMLLAAGANRNAKDTEGYTPLDTAKFPNHAPNDDVIKALEGP